MVVEQVDLDECDQGHECEDTEQTLNHTEIVLKPYPKLREWNVLDPHTLYLVLLVLPLVIDELFFIELLSQLLNEILP